MGGRRHDEEGVMSAFNGVKFVCRMFGIKYRATADGRTLMERSRHIPLWIISYSDSDTMRVTPEDNAPLAMVERLVGHSSPAMTRHYTDVGDEATAKAIASLPSMLGGGTPAPADAGVSAMGDEELRRLAEAVAAETARRRV